MSSSDMSTAMADFLRLLAEEVDKNQALAKRLAVPFDELIKKSRPKSTTSAGKKRKKTNLEVPEGFDPFQIYHDQGRVGLCAALERYDAGQCKAILSHFALDPSRSYVRWRKQERLANFIIERVKAISEKGKVFMD